MTSTEMRACLACSKPIARNPKWSWRYYATRLYCNRQCARSIQPHISTDYKVAESGCWEWLGRIDRNGYGKAYDAERPPGLRVDWAHRVSYRRLRGPIPDGHELDHTCQNTVCVNPDHLEVVTKAQHAQRTMSRLGKDDLHASAARLRCLGLTYEEVAQALGLGGRTTAADAVQAAIRKGLVNASDLPQVPRLDDADREDIAALYILGISQTEIAAWYRIDSSHVSRLCSGGLSERERRALKKAAS